MKKTSAVLIGIDLGTTMIKVAAFCADTGKFLGAAGGKLRVNAAPNGKREQDPTAVDRGFARALRELAEHMGRPLDCVTGIGLAAQGGSAIVMDRDSGAARTPMMLWNDTRPYALLPDIQARKPTRFWMRLTGNTSPGAGLARLEWYRKRQTKLFNDRNLYGGAGEFLYHRLTNVWKQDAGNALQIGSYNINTEDNDARLLDVVGVPLSFVAPMRKGHETHPLTKPAAHRLGLPPGIPVAGPYMDHEAGYMSALSRHARPLQCSLGTAWVGNFMLPPGQRGTSPIQLILPAPTGRGTLVVQPIRCGNLTWDWAVDKLDPGSLEAGLSRANSLLQRQLLPPRGLTMLPWFTQPNPADAQALGAGALVGLNTHTCAADVLRAAAAGLCFEMIHMFEQVRDSGAVNCVVLGGGTSKGSGFRRLLACLFDPLPVFWCCDDTNAGARGTLFSFNRTAACSKTVRVRISSSDAEHMTCTQHAYDLYRDVRARIYGNNRATQGYRMTK